MAIKLEAKDRGEVLEVALTGKLVKADYETFVPAVERLIEQHGKIRLLVVMHDFHGWTAGAMWADTKFAAHHFKDIERLAVVGEKKWQHGMAVFCKPFTKAEIRYFDQAEADKARAWLEEAIETKPANRRTAPTRRECHDQRTSSLADTPFPAWNACGFEPNELAADWSAT